MQYRFAFILVGILTAQICGRAYANTIAVNYPPLRNMVLPGPWKEVKADSSTGYRWRKLFKNGGGDITLILSVWDSPAPAQLKKLLQKEPHTLSLAEASALSKTTNIPTFKTVLERNTPQLSTLFLNHRLVLYNIFVNASTQRSSAGVQEKVGTEAHAFSTTADGALLDIALISNKQDKSTLAALFEVISKTVVWQ